MNSKSTDFGYQEVTPEEKTSRVTEVFRSVSGNYDVMNDLMSFGVHRLWKRQAVHLSGVKKGQSVLDVAGGTGDLSKLFHQRVGKEGNVLMTDINSAMLHEGRDKMIDAGIVSGIDYAQANAEVLPFADNSFDCINIAFGLRNVTDKQKAINSMFEKLRYGGCLIILEFSKIKLSLLSHLYDAYSLNVIPKIGKIVAKDEASYQYLVESIRMHPDQETLKGMIEAAGFSKVEYFNLTGGIVAIHRAYKL
ncbi:MAG: demethylmenaquinone methyltransferase/2-methoxy-6-polyprenyl-1,4-benzoquinol methylase [Gammaproteobacteria bacterium]|jgi:demethylmenaquinone methyltransferase/2-methoxy-6-polyprenyl-1,4-benzoquinol methylase